MRLAGCITLLALLATASLLVFRSPWSYAAQDRALVGTGASSTHPIGTDELGRDRAVRTGAALLLGLAGSVLASGFASAISVALGTAAGFAAPWIGGLLLYLSDLFLTLPWLFLLMIVRSVCPLTMSSLRSAGVTFLLLGFLGAPAFLRVHYTRTRELRRAEWLVHGRALGLRPLQMVRQLVPHLRPMLFTQFLLYIPACLIAEANLGTLGLGIPDPLPSWGSLLQSLQSTAVLNSTKLVYLPIALLVIVLMLLELLVIDPEEARS